MPHADHYRNGVKLVSATELMSIINKPFLDKWKESLCSFQNGQCGFVRAKQVAEEASDLGNKVHEEVANWLTDGSLLNPSEWTSKIILKLSEAGIKKYLIEPESTLLDAESNLAGSPDFVGEDKDGKKFIGDLKIKNSLDTLTALQGVAYRYLIRRKHNEDINTMAVVWAKKKTKGMLVEIVMIDLNEWQDDWIALTKLWNRLNPSRKVVVHDK